MWFLEACKMMANAFLTANKNNRLFSCWTFLMFWSVVSWSTIPNSNNHSWFWIQFTGVILQFSHTICNWVYIGWSEGIVFIVSFPSSLSQVVLVSVVSLYFRSTLLSLDRWCFTLIHFSFYWDSFFVFRLTLLSF